MTPEQLRDLLWWAFRKGSENRKHFEDADGECLNHLDFFLSEVNRLVNNLEEGKDDWK